MKQNGLESAKYMCTLYKPAELYWKRVCNSHDASMDEPSLSHMGEVQKPPEIRSSIPSTKFSK